MTETAPRTDGARVAARPSSDHEVIVAGASAGGVEALRALVAGLPPDFGGSVLVVLHVAAGSTSVLGEILDRSGPLTAATAVDGEPLRRGHVHVGRSDHHLLVADGHLQLTHGPREHGHRPSIDPLFRSAASAYGSSVVAVVLSGNGDDGSAGALAVHDAGGHVLVQRPDDALFRTMPHSALRALPGAEALPATELGSRLADLVSADPGDGPIPLIEPRLEIPRGPAEPGRATATGMRCPECNGPIWEKEDRGLVRYECRVGHAYSTESMLQAQESSMEAILWGALAALEERADLMERMSRRAEDRGSPYSERSFRGKAEQIRAEVEALRAFIVAGGVATPAEEGSGR